MPENSEEARRRERANDKERTDHSDSSSSSKDDDDTDANAASRASQSDDAIIDTSQVPYEDDDGENTGNDDDRDRWTPENGTEFNENDAKYTTLSSDYSEEDPELDSLLNPIDDKLRALHSAIQDNRKKLQDIDMDSPHALSQMRNIMLENNEIEDHIYNDMKLIETHSTDYQEIKDRLLPEDGKKLFQRLKPLFDISKKEQMDTFVQAFYNINSIEKNGYLKNLLDLATFFKEHKSEILGEEDDKDGQDGTPHK